MVLPVCCAWAFTAVCCTAGSHPWFFSAIFARVHLHFYVDYIIHFLLAHSRHGTHSPFVYRLVDEVIYANRQPGEPYDKVKRLTARLIDRFQPSTVYSLADEQPQVSALDFVVIDQANHKKAVARLSELWPRLHSGSVLLLLGPYRNAEAKALWQLIKAKPDVTVTIDLFSVGVVFFHSGQAKEDFKIRY